MGGPLLQGCLQPAVVRLIEIRENVDVTQVGELRGKWQPAGVPLATLAAFGIPWLISRMPFNLEPWLPT